MRGAIRNEKEREKDTERRGKGTRKGRRKRANEFKSTSRARIG